MTPITFRGKTYDSELEMPQDVRQAYQEQRIRRTSTTSLTNVVDMPADMRHLSSDESTYRSSSPIINPEYNTIEPESSMVIRGLVFGILWSLALIAAVFLVVELFQQIF